MNVVLIEREPPFPLAMYLPPLAGRISTWYPRFSQYGPAR
jgi:hypothetical protein